MCDGQAVVLLSDTGWGLAFPVKALGLQCQAKPGHFSSSSLTLWVHDHSKEILRLGQKNSPFTVQSLIFFFFPCERSMVCVYKTLFWTCRFQYCWLAASPPATSPFCKVLSFTAHQLSYLPEAQVWRRCCAVRRAEPLRDRFLTVGLAPGNALQLPLGPITSPPDKPRSANSTF